MRATRDSRRTTFLIIILSFIFVFFSSEVSAGKSNKYAREKSQDRYYPIETHEKEMDADSKEERVHEDQAKLVKAIDRRYRFAKKYQSEATIFGGSYLGDEWHGTWDVGGAYKFFFSNLIGIGASYFYSPIITDNSSTFGSSLRTKQTHTATGFVVINNDCAMRAGKTIIECDMYLTVGGGAMRINRIWKPTGLIGGGLKVYTPLPWLAVMVEVDSYLHETPNPTGDTFDADIAFNAGVSFIFPIKKYEEKEVEELEDQ